jgi:hypothetical protein
MLVRPFHIPTTEVVKHGRALDSAGVAVYAWSGGEGESARISARDLGLEVGFQAFLPEPHVMIDDQPPSDWRRLVVHPGEAAVKAAGDCARAAFGEGAR